MLFRFVIQPFLSRLSPESSIRATLSFLHLMRRMHLNLPFRLTHKKRYPALSCRVFDLDFPNPVGLAAGVDRDGKYYNTLSDMGFGFVEIGSLTHIEQPGRDRPRIFRLKKDQALAERCGYPNKGVKYAIRHLQSDPPKIPVAANLICRAQSVSEEEIIADYRESFALLYDFADFFVINTVMPPFDGVDLLEDIEVLSDVMDAILDMRLCYDSYKPVLLKISSDISRESLTEIIDYARLAGIDGIVCSSGTTRRDGLKDSRNQRLQHVRISGGPLFEHNLELVRFVHSYTEGRLPIIASGGILSPTQAQQMLDAGASLIELCTGIFYQGPSLVKHTLRFLDQERKRKQT